MKKAVSLLLIFTILLLNINITFGNSQNIGNNFSYMYKMEGILDDVNPYSNSPTIGDSTFNEYIGRINNIEKNLFSIRSFYYKSHILGGLIETQKKLNIILKQFDYKNDVILKEGYDSIDNFRLEICNFSLGQNQSKYGSLGYKYKTLDSCLNKMTIRDFVNYINMYGYVNIDKTNKILKFLVFINDTDLFLQLINTQLINILVYSNSEVSYFLSDVMSLLKIYTSSDKFKESKIGKSFGGKLINLEDNIIKYFGGKIKGEKYTKKFLDIVGCPDNCSYNTESNKKVIEGILKNILTYLKEIDTYKKLSDDSKKLINNFFEFSSFSDEIEVEKQYILNKLTLKIYKKHLDKIYSNISNYKNNWEKYDTNYDIIFFWNKDKTNIDKLKQFNLGIFSNKIIDLNSISGALETISDIFRGGMKQNILGIVPLEVGELPVAKQVGITSEISTFIFKINRFNNYINTKQEKIDKFNDYFFNKGLFKNTYKTTQEKIDELRAKNTNQSIKLKQNINYSSDIGLGNRNNIEEIHSIKYYEELNNNKYYSAFYNKIKTLSTQALNNLKIENEKKINLLLAQKESNSRNNNISLLNLMNNAILSKQSELKQINNTSKEIINTDTQKSENISISVPKNDNFDLEKDVGLIYYDKNYLKLLRYNGKDYQINNIDLEKIIISGDNVLVAESDKNDLKKIKLIKNGKDYQNITVHSNILYWGKNSFDMYSDNIVYINNTSYESGFQYIGDIYLNDKKIKENGVFVRYSKGVLYYILKNGGKYELYKNHQYVDVLQNKNGNRYNDSLILDGENYAYLNNENNLIVNGKNFGEVKGIDFKSIILNGNDITYTESDYGWSCNIYMNGKKSEDKLCVRDNLNPEGYIKYSYGKDYYREFNNGYNNYYINGKNIKDNFDLIDYFFGNGRDLLLVFGNKDSKSSSSPRNLMLFKNGQEIQKTVNKDIYDGGSGVGGIYFIKGGVFIKNRYGKIYYNFQEQSIDFKVSNIILNNFIMV